MTNCRKGDMAIVIRASNPANIGQIVRCIEFYSGPGRLPSGAIGHTDAGWKTEPRLRWTDGSLVTVIRDSALRPIRDPGNDAVDEMVALLGAPKKEAA